MRKLATLDYAHLARWLVAGLAFIVAAVAVAYGSWKLTKKPRAASIPTLIEEPVSPKADVLAGPTSQAAEVVRRLERHKGSVTSLVDSHLGVLSGSTDRTMQWWDLKAANEWHRYERPHEIAAVAFATAHRETKTWTVAVAGDSNGTIGILRNDDFPW